MSAGCSPLGVKRGFWMPSWFRPFIEEPLNTEDVDPKVRQRPAYKAFCLLGLSITGFVVQLVTALYTLPAIAPTALWGVIAVYLACIRPRIASIAIVVLLVGVFALQIILFASHWPVSIPSRWSTQSTLGALGASSAVLSFIATVLVVNMPLREQYLPRTEISQPYTDPTNSLRSPEDNLTLWQWMTVSWMMPLISLGSKRQLHDEDVWSLGYEFQHRHLHDAFKDLKGTVMRRVLRANWIDLVVLTVLALVELVANYSTPLLLQKLLQAMEDIEVSKRPAITFATITLVVRLIAAQSSVFSLWFGRRCYERSRGEMITMLFEKTLNRKIIGSVNNEAINVDTRLGDDDQNTGEAENAGHDYGDEREDDGLLNGKPGNTNTSKLRTPKWLKKAITYIPFGLGERAEKPKKMPASMGKILNLMRGDVYEVAQRFWEFQSIINKPLGLILSVVLVWRLIGWPCLIGIAIVLIVQGLNALLVRQLISWERVRRAATDAKLQQISQYVEAIRHLRWYGWHPTWLDRIMKARQKELNLKVVTYLWNLAIVFINSLGSGILPVASFWAYTTLAGHELRVSIAFPALQLFILLQGNLRDIPGLITVLLNANVAIGRIEDFMAEPDKGNLEWDNSSSNADDRLEVKDASFAWPGLSQDILTSLSLSFPPGLTVIFGTVAAGKTALLQALLGELDLRAGELIKPDTPIAYCAQSPWLQSMTIRDNILFGSPYDEARYKQTLDVCALLTDFANFKHGDLSAIGENGIGLSGGQKARVALARAVYSRARILMLDDPLSALDQQTAESIVAKCFAGDLMNGRTLILVTHRTDLCHGLAEQVIEVTDGTARIIDDDQLAAGVAGSYSIPTEPNPASEESSEEQEAAAVPEKFTEDEHRQHGGVQAKVYWQYVKAGKLRWWAIVILSAVFCRFTRVVESWFLKEWGEAYNEAGAGTFAFQDFDTIRIRSTLVSRLFDRFPDPSDNVGPWLIGYLVIVVLQATAFAILDGFMLVVTYFAGRQMFRDIMKRVSHATFRFYDVTPVGRLMNRLTSDIGTIDGNISKQLLNVAWQVIAWVSAVIVIASITPVFLIFSLALTSAFVFTFMRFLPTSQSLRRLEMVSLSPLMSNFGALLEGLTTVRAFCAQSQFQDRVITVTDAFQKMDHFYWSLQTWLMYRFDILSGCSTFILTLLAIFSGLSSGLTAFLLVSASSFVRATHELCKQYGQLQLEFVSVERVVELLHLDQEPSGSVDPPAWWPSYNSDIVFEDVTVRYAPHLDPALSGVSFTLKGGSNTAVIGRTGSGKSTLALALLATVAPETGRILIGGIDICKADKQALRTRVTFLAQDPVLFPGSLRHNLDPTEEHSDEACQAVIARVCGSYSWTLETQIDAGGKNLSQGQRQLVGLARAILRRSAIIIMDEATASIDKETAWEIQRVLREEMTDSTVITIAHRPSAVRDADYCLALGNGRVIGEGSPDDVGDMVFGQTNGGGGGSDQEDRI